MPYLSIIYKVLRLKNPYKVSQDDEEFSSLLKTISIDGKWLHPSVIFGLRRHKNLKKLNLKLNSDGAIPRDGWSDLSIDELIEHNQTDKVIKSFHI